MNVSGIRPYSGYYQYNSNRIDELSSQQGALEAQAANKVDSQSEAVEPKVEVNVGNDARSRQNETAFDYASRYVPDVGLDLKGKDSDLASLDVEKAMSDLNKDRVLEQYQYFVGTSGADGSVTATQKPAEDSIVHVAENFTL